MRWSKAADACRKAGDTRAVQLQPGHTNVESTVRYLGVKLYDALSIAERINV